MDDPSEATAAQAAGAEQIRRRVIQAEFPEHDPGTARPGPAAAWGPRRSSGGDDQEFMAMLSHMAVLSHELRNSLCVLRSAAGILRRAGEPGPGAVKARQLIERQVAQMSRLVDDLLDVSRIRTGRLHLQFTRIDLCAVLSACLETLEPLMQQHGHRLSASMPLAPLWLTGDAMRLEQVFVNLLSNAAKFTDRGGQIDLSLAIDGSQAVVRIRDNGVGIAAEFLPHVFELFRQAPVASGDAQAGLGIGLALARTLVESHLGSISAASAGLGRGSEFTVRLPLPAPGA